MPSRVADRLLSGQFALAVDAKRRCRSIDPIRLRAFAIENVIGGVMHHRHSVAGTPARDDARRFCVGAERLHMFLFGTVNGRVGRRVHHRIRLHTVKQCRQFLRPVEVGGLAGVAIG
ncbi:hypothetical protein D3C81_2001630 [compost metagenome]